MEWLNLDALTPEHWLIIATGGSALAAIAAAVISVTVLLGDRRRRKSALVVGRLVSIPSRTGFADHFALMNLGAAEARQVRVSLTDSEGKPWSALSFGRPSAVEKFPVIPSLAAGDTMLFGFTMYAGNDPSYLGVTTCWKDERRKMQSRRATLSTIALPYTADIVHGVLGEMKSEMRLTGVVR